MIGSLTVKLVLLRYLFIGGFVMDQDPNFDFYLQNQDKFVGIYNERSLVIRNQIVVDAYDTFTTAYIKALEMYKPGTFRIQKVSSGSQHHHFMNLCKVCGGSISITPMSSSSSIIRCASCKTEETVIE